MVPGHSHSTRKIRGTYSSGKTENQDNQDIFYSTSMLLRLTASLSGTESCSFSGTSMVSSNDLSIMVLSITRHCSHTREIHGHHSGSERRCSVRGEDRTTGVIEVKKRHESNIS